VKSINKLLLSNFLFGLSSFLQGQTIIAKVYRFGDMLPADSWESHVAYKIFV